MFFMAVVQRWGSLTVTLVSLPGEKQEKQELVYKPMGHVSLSPSPSGEPQAFSPEVLFLALGFDGLEASATGRTYAAMLAVVFKNHLGKTNLN